MTPALAERIFAPGWKGVLVLGALGFLLAWLMDRVHGFDDPRLAAWLGLIGTLLLGVPGMLLNRRAYHAHRLVKLRAELKDAAGPTPAPGTPRADLIRRINREISAIHQTTTAWSPATTAMLYAGYVFILAAGAGAGWFGPGRAL